MEIKVTGNIKATVELYAVAPRKAGKAIREYMAKLQKDGIEIPELETDDDGNVPDEVLEKMAKEDMNSLNILNNISHLVTINMIKDIGTDGTALKSIDEFLDIIEESDYHKIAAAAGKIYKKSTDKIQKKTKTQKTT